MVYSHDARKRKIRQARAHHSGAKQQGRRRKQHRRHITGKPRNSKRRRRAVAKQKERARRCSQTRDQDLRRQIREILLEAQPRMVTVESLRGTDVKASARGTADHAGKNAAAKRKLNESYLKRPSATSADCGVKKPPSWAYPPFSSRRRACPVPDAGARRRPARLGDTGTRETARARRCSGVVAADSAPTPTGPPASSFATAPVCATANGNLGPRQYDEPEDGRFRRLRSSGVDCCHAGAWLQSRRLPRHSLCRQLRLPVYPLR